MATLKAQLIDLRDEAGKQITKILQEYVDKTGHMPGIIDVEYIDVSEIQDKEKTVIVQHVDISNGLFID